MPAKGKNFVVCLFAAALLVSSGCAPGISSQTPTRTFTDNTRIINVTSGERFVIELPFNPTVPYQWELDIQGSVNLVSETFIPTTPVLTGSGGNIIFTFETIDPGSATITFSYTGPDGVVSETKIFQVETVAA